VRRRPDGCRNLATALSATAKTTRSQGRGILDGISITHDLESACVCFGSVGHAIHLNSVIRSAAKAVAEEDGQPAPAAPRASLRQRLDRSIRHQSRFRPVTHAHTHQYLLGMHLIARQRDGDLHVVEPAGIIGAQIPRVHQFPK